MGAMRSYEKDINDTKKRNRKLKRAQGFTLLEVIVAIGILTVGLLAIASMHFSAIQGNYLARRLTEGTTFDQDKLEELLTLPFNDADLQDANPTVGESTTYSEPSPPPGYTITWDVDDFLTDTDGSFSAKVIKVTVTWQDKGVSRRTELSCVKPRL